MTRPLAALLALLVSSAASACGDTSETSASRTLDRHREHRDRAIERCLQRCQSAFGPGDTDLSDNTCEAQCYPYLVDTDQIREEVEVRRGDEEEDPLAPRPEPGQEAPLAPVEPPAPEYETEYYE